MGCIKIEPFEEKDFSRENFGQNKPAYINASDEPAEVYVNINDIAQFEKITLITPRPGTTANKQDNVDGVRLLTHTGNIYVIFSDGNHTFDEAFSQADVGFLWEFDRERSHYLQQFKK